MHVLLPPGPRHLLGGVIAATVIVAVFAIVRELTTETPPMPSEWLTESDQEALADSVTIVDSDGWIAACLWEKRNPRDIAKVVDHPKGTIRTWNWQTPSGREVSILAVDDAPPGHGSFDEVIAPGAFCYAPVH